MAQKRRPGRRPGINLSAAERLYIGSALNARIQELRSQRPEGWRPALALRLETEEAENLRARIMDGMLPGHR